MSTMNCGGLAFPGRIWAGKDALGNDQYEPQPGMSLRDWFAGQALMGVLADPNCGHDLGRTAEWAYMCADAMIAEREKFK